MSKIAGNLSQNFKRVFLETTFFGLACTISQVLMNRFIWNLVWMFFKQSSIASTTLGSKFVILLFLKNSELPKKHAKKENFFSNSRHFVEKIFVRPFQGSCYSHIYTNKESVRLFCCTRPEGLKSCTPGHPFFLGLPPLCQLITLCNFEFLFSVNFLCNLKISINKW